MHAVGPRASQREILVAVSVDVSPLHAVIGVERPKGVGCDVVVEMAGVSE
jgi:hypothetical protein